MRVFFEAFRVCQCAYRAYIQNLKSFRSAARLTILVPAIVSRELFPETLCNCSVLGNTCSANSFPGIPSNYAFIDWYY